MLWFLAFLVAFYLIGELCKKLNAVIQEGRAFLNRRAALEDIYREQSVNELRSISMGLNGCELPSLSSRINAADKDLRSRRELRNAMEHELGVK